MHLYWLINISPKNFSPFYFTSPEIIEVKICSRQTDRQTNSLTTYTGECGFFLQVKFATSLLSSLAGEYASQSNLLCKWHNIQATFWIVKCFFFIYNFFYLCSVAFFCYKMHKNLFTQTTFFYCHINALLYDIIWLLWHQAKNQGAKNKAERQASLSP